jgi:hypothetical protein
MIINNFSGDIAVVELVVCAQKNNAEDWWLIGMVAKVQEGRHPRSATRDQEC